jgi:rubredoxin
MNVVLQSIITCPHCEFAKEETMPTDTCQFLYQCANCQTIFRPLKGDCCVYCSYGTVPCPSKQNPVPSDIDVNP